MPMPIHSGRIELPERMRSRLDEFRRRLWMIKICDGLLAGLFGLLASYTLVFVLDRFGETPPLVRGGILLLGTVGLGLGFPLILHRWVWGTRRLEQIARLVRRRYPRLGDQLLGIVELAQAERDAQACSDDLLRAAVGQVDDEIATRRFDDAAPNTRLRRWDWAAGVVTALVAFTLVVTPAAGFNALARWLMPWRDTDRYTFAQQRSTAKPVSHRSGRGSTHKLSGCGCTPSTTFPAVSASIRRSSSYMFSVRRSTTSG